MRILTGKEDNKEVQWIEITKEEYSEAIKNEENKNDYTVSFEQDTGECIYLKKIK
jgi:hypothetical protein